MLSYIVKLFFNFEYNQSCANGSSATQLITYAQTMLINPPGWGQNIYPLLKLEAAHLADLQGNWSSLE